MSKIAGTPECKRVRSQIVARESRSAFAAFTAQDSAAYSAFIHGAELWSVSGGSGILPSLDIMRASMRAMQSRLRYLCKETLIAMIGADEGMGIWYQLQIDSDGWPIAIETGRTVPDLPPLHVLPPRPRDGGATRQSMAQLADAVGVDVPGVNAPLQCKNRHPPRTITELDGALMCLKCGKNYGPVPK